MKGSLSEERFPVLHLLLHKYDIFQDTSSLDLSDVNTKVERNKHSALQESINLSRS